MRRSVPFNKRGAPCWKRTRPELTETLKAEVAENLEADRVEIDELLSNLSAAESSLNDARCELSSVYNDLKRCRR